MKGYVVFRIGSHYFYQPCNDASDLVAESENIMDHVLLNGNIVLLCGDLEEAANIFDIIIGDIKPLD